ncbi:hypothetical protein SDJN03_24918, partial [Cucurbita argyrosperma subsp. sororia]
MSCKLQKHCWLWSDFETISVEVNVKTILLDRETTSQMIEIDFGFRERVFLIPALIRFGVCDIGEVLSSL